MTTFYQHFLRLWNWVVGGVTTVVLFLADLVGPLLEVGVKQEDADSPAIRGCDPTGKGPVGNPLTTSPSTLPAVEVEPGPREVAAAGSLGRSVTFTPASLTVESAVVEPSTTVSPST